jgi:Mg2+/Co2+ transporter CorB
MAPLAIPVAGAVTICGLLLVSSFFSSSEIAIFSLSDQAIADLDASSDPRVERLRALRSDPHRLLVTLLVGNNVVNLAIGSLTTALVLEYLSAGLAVAVATVIGSSVVLVFGEIVPKSYGLGHAESWSLRVAGALHAVEWLLTPLVVVFEWITGGINRAVEGDGHIERPYLEPS